ncbi:hypothetical protein [Winslowiella toletana]|uniref:hypothetical protein n=1 Tax=Winslowiella toletana TaxID=92490 RepID=UPI0028BEF8D9|nr:hypothetical protein [Winslowiella toletana]WNN46440.1 hypothetical protein RIN69_11590 [Winslowiella toletana]
MRRRAATGKLVLSVTGLSLYSLRSLKPRREGRVCYRLDELKKQFQQTLESLQICINRSNELSLLLQKMLSWSGSLTHRELDRQKQKISGIHAKQQHLTLQQQSLLRQLRQMQNRQEQLITEWQSLLLKRGRDDAVGDNENFTA